MPYQEKCKLVKKEILKDDIFKFTVETENISKEARPGQFLEIRVADNVEPFLRRPISIHSIEDNKLVFIFQIKGKGTEILSAKKEGEEIDIIGPLGYGTFAVKEYNKVAIIGGGIGTFPLYELAKQLKGKAEVNIYLGFRNKEYVTLEKEFGEVADKLVICTDDGSYGEKGYAIDLLKKDFENEKPDMVFACGPTPMLRVIRNYAIENDVKAQLSLEERMGCGLGVCLGCAVKVVENGNETYKHVCKEGPVFFANQVEI